MSQVNCKKVQYSQNNNHDNSTIVHISCFGFNILKTPKDHKFFFFLVSFIISIAIYTMFQLFVIPFIIMKITISSKISKNLITLSDYHLWNHTELVIFFQICLKHVQWFDLFHVSVIVRKFWCFISENDCSGVVLVAGITKSNLVNLSNSGIKTF